MLTAYGSRALTLGIRPEHLRLTVPAPKHLAVTVIRAEALGSETYLTVALADAVGADASEGGPDEKTLLMRLDGVEENVPRPGNQLTIGMRVEHIHLFDPETGDAINKVP